MKQYFLKSVFLILIFFLTACKENLIRIKSETDANKILLSLRESGVNANKVFETTDWIIKVDENQFTEALSVLERKRLYGRAVGEGKKAELDLFSTHAQKTNEMLERISEKLSESIMMMPGIVDARVHIYKEDSDSILNIIHKQSASVVLVSEHLNVVSHEQIKIIVSKGAGVPVEFVAVIESLVQKQKSNENSITEVLSIEDDGRHQVTATIYENISTKNIMMTVGISIMFILSTIFSKKVYDFLVKRKNISAITKILES